MKRALQTVVIDDQSTKTFSDRDLRSTGREIPLIYSSVSRWKITRILLFHLIRSNFRQSNDLTLHFLLLSRREDRLNFVLFVKQSEIKRKNFCNFISFIYWSSFFLSTFYKLSFDKSRPFSVHLQTFRLFPFLRFNFSRNFQICRYVGREILSF